MQVDEKKALEQLLKRGVRIPPQPRVLIEFRKLLASDNYEMREVARVISQDPGIVAMVFRAARSPSFVRAKGVHSLEQILMVLGIKQVFNLVQAAALTTSLSGSTRRALEIFWSRAHQIAQIAAVIAEDRISVCNVFPDQAYLAGIFHECGVPVLMMRFPEYCSSLRLENATCWPNLADEDAKHLVDHCSVGYLVARHWGLPDFVCDAIRFHHDIPEERTIGASVTLVAIIQMAGYCYHRLQHVEFPLWDRIGRRVLSELGLGPDEESDYYNLIVEQFLDRNA